MLHRVKANGAKKTTKKSAKTAPAKTKRGSMKSARADAAAPATGSPIVLAAPSLDTTRSIALTDADWRWATWRELPPPPPDPPARSFDLAECCERLATKVKVIGKGAEWDFSEAGIDGGMSREEARFWLECLLGIQRSVPPAKKAAELGKKTLAPVALPSVRRRLTTCSEEPAPELALVLARLFSPMAVSEWFLEEKPPCEEGSAGGRFFHGYREHVFPRLTAEEKAELRQRIAPEITIASFANDATDDERRDPSWLKYAGTAVDHFKEPSGAFFLAVLLGMHRELEAVVKALPSSWYRGEGKSDGYNVPQVMIFGLGSPELVKQEMARLQLSLHHPSYVRAWLAHTEYSGLDAVADTIVETKDRGRAAALAEVLALVRAPENTGPMLSLALRSKVPEIGAAWLEKNVGHSISGYVALAGGHGPLASAATQRLRTLAAAGHAARIDEVTRSATGDAGRTAREAVAAVARRVPVLEKEPPWLAAGLAKAKKLERPRWIAIETLPDIEIAGHKLAPAHVDALLAALSSSESITDDDRALPRLELAHPLVLAVREHATPASRDAFAWRLFEEWLFAGAPPRNKWAFLAVGFLGGDASVLRLAPMIREWPGKNLHQRAVLGIDVLGAIGSDAALVQIAGVAQKLYFPALKRRAEDVMIEIAGARGMSPEELADEIVPHGGFDANGRRTFERSGRTFDVVLGPEATPMLRDAASGARVPDLPEPADGDDRVEARRVAAEWSTLQGTLAETFAIQAERLEQAMVAGRRWSPQKFERLLVRHPLMGHIARTLVWGAFAPGAAAAELQAKVRRLKGASASTHGEDEPVTAPATTFRVAEDGSLADVNDGEMRLSRKAEIGIVHPLDLDLRLREKWSVLLAEYEIIPPFEQLGRTLHALEDGEAKADDLSARFEEKTWPARQLIDSLRQRGWTHGHAGRGIIASHFKRFPGAGVTAVVGHDAYAVSSVPEEEAMQVHSIYFLLGGNRIDEQSDYGVKIPLGRIDPKAISEVLYDLSS